MPMLHGASWHGRNAWNGQRHFRKALTPTIIFLPSTTQSVFSWSAPERFSPENTGRTLEIC